MMGIATSSITMSLYYELIPRTQHIFREKLIADVEEVLYNVIRRERRMVFSDSPYAMFVREVQGKRLLDVIFKRRLKIGETYVGYDLVARAREAKLRFDAENGIVHLDMDRCVVYSGDKNVVGNFTHRSFPFPLPPSLMSKDKKSRVIAMTWEEMRTRQVEIEIEREDLIHQLADSELELKNPKLTSTQSRDITVHTYHLQNKIQDAERQRRNIELEIQMRPAISCGCLCFVLVGCPVGIWASRADFLSTFVKCFLPIVFIYYPLLLAGSNLARDGKVPAFVAVWAANGVLFMGGLYLMWRLVRR